jgi:hypothetical protein
MCDKQVLSLKKSLHSLPARVPKIVVPRVDEMFPALKESMVSVLCLVHRREFYFLISRKLM